MLLYHPTGRGVGDNLSVHSWDVKRNMLESWNSFPGTYHAQKVSGSYQASVIIAEA